MYAASYCTCGNRPSTVPAVLLRRSVEEPPLMSAAAALELQHADTRALDFDCWLAALRAGNSSALRRRCCCVVRCHGATIRGPRTRAADRCEECCSAAIVLTQGLISFKRNRRQHTFSLQRQGVV